MTSRFWSAGGNRALSPARGFSGNLDPSSGYALYLPFSAASPTYRSGATVGALSTMPGYSYTRSGAKQELLSSSSVYATVFAANAPGIVPAVGYYSRSAFTNYCLQSQTFDNATWSKGGTAVVTADFGVAPDGTTTADRYQATTGAAYSAPLSQTGLASTGTTSRNLSVWMRSLTGGNVTVNVDLTEPAVLDHNIEYTVTPTWQRFTNAQVFGSSASGTNVAFNSGTLGIGFDILIWGAQVSAGSDPGPIIATTTVAAALGADVLSETQTKPTGAFVIYGKAVLSLTKAAVSTLFNWSDGTASNVVSAQLSASNLVTFTVTNATVNTPVTGEGGTPTGARNVTFALRFNGSTWRGFINGVVMGAESAAAAIPAGTAFNEGHALGASQLNDAVAGLYVIEAAKTDAEVIALMNAL